MRFSGRDWTANEVVNEVLLRLSLPLSGGSFGTTFRLRPGVGCQVLCRSENGSNRLEIVWKLDSNDSSANARRADFVFQDLNGKVPYSVGRRAGETGIVHYVGIFLPIVEVVDANSLFSVAATYSQMLWEIVDKSAIPAS